MMKMKRQTVDFFGESSIPTGGGSQWKKMIEKKSSPMHPRLYELIEGLLGVTVLGSLYIIFIA